MAARRKSAVPLFLCKRPASFVGAKGLAEEQITAFPLRGQGKSLPRALLQRQNSGCGAAVYGAFPGAFAGQFVSFRAAAITASAEAGSKKSTLPP